MKGKVTIYDIAERLQISTATVNRALNNKSRVSEATRQAVLETAAEMGYKPNTLARSLNRRTIRIAVVGCTSFPEFHNQYMDGARETQQELVDFNVTVDYFSYDGRDSNSIKGEMYLQDKLRHVAQSGYDGTLVLAKYLEEFHLLKEKKVAVATAINDIPRELRVFCIQYNGYVAGKIAAQLLHWRSRGNRPVAIASATHEPGIHADIVEGFHAQQKDTPVELATVYYHYDSDKIAYDSTGRVLRQYPDLGGLYVNSYNSAGVLRSIRDHGMEGKLCVVTSDINSLLKEQIRSGTVDASIYQDQYTQGKLGLRYLFQYLAEDAQIQDTVRINPQVILRSNMDLY